MNIEYAKKLFSLDGRKAVVTGASQGIGKAIAESLAQLGAEVAVLGRNEAYLKEVEGKINGCGGKCESYIVDVCKKNEINSFFDFYYEKHDGELDIFINNAAYTEYYRALETPESAMDGLWATNVKGALFCMQRSIEGMKKRGGGNIVIVTSVNALWPLPPQAVYTSTKCALEGLMRCIAPDMAKYNIRVNTCAPGGINTNMNAAFFSKPGALEEAGKDIALGRIGESCDIGEVVACMVTDAFRYMTGATVLVDGGLMLRMV